MQVFEIVADDYSVSSGAGLWFAVKFMGRAFSPLELFAPVPGALPQAGIKRAFGPEILVPELAR